MLPQVRAAFLGMTLLTGIVDRLPGELCRCIVAVRAVASGAVHLSLQERMRERFHRLATLQLVTIEANLGLGRCLQNGVCAHVTVVTVDTGDLIDRMRAGVPAEADIAVVTAETLAILIFDRCRTGRTEERNCRSFLPAANPACVVTTGPVTGLALQLAVTERATRIVRVRV
jgi:hypothetical protein